METQPWWERNPPPSIPYHVLRTSDHFAAIDIMCNGDWPLAVEHGLVEVYEGECGHDHYRLTDLGWKVSHNRLMEYQLEAPV